MIENIEQYINIPASVLDINLPNFEIHLTGPKFDSNLSTSIMSVFLKLQTAYNQAYALAKYGTSCTLTAEDKAEAELFIKVDSGSSKYVIDLSAIAVALIAKMNGLELFPILGIFAAVAIAGMGIDHGLSILSDKIKSKRASMDKNKQFEHEETMERMRLEHEAKLKEMDNERQLASDRALHESSKKALDCLETVIKTGMEYQKSLSKTCADSNAQVEINQQKHSRDELLETSKFFKDQLAVDRITTDDFYPKHMEGDYYIEEAKYALGEDGKRTLGLVDATTGDRLKNVLLTEDKLTPEQREILRIGADEKPVHLDLYAVYKDSAYTTLAGVTIKTSDQAPLLPGNADE